MQAQDAAELREILDAVPSGVWVTASDGRILDANPAACEMLGFSRGDLLGTSIVELTHPDDRAGRQGLVLLTPGSVAVRRRRLRQRDGGWVLVEGRVRVLPDGRFVTVVHDVTELARTERALAESEREFRSIFELALSGKASADPHTGRYLRVNPKLCQITGYSERELLARTFSDITHPDDRARDREAFDRVVRGEAPGWTSEKRYVRKDGRVVWVIVTGTLLRDEAGRPARSFATIHDITDRKEMEAALRDADHRKDEFLALLSHELRNPLAPMRTALALLAAEPAPEAAGRARAVLERQVLHLSRLVDDLLDLTRVSQGKIQLRREPVDLCDVALRAVEDHRGLFAAAAVTLDVGIAPGPEMVDGDPTRLAQVVGNLLQNAAKFTPAGGGVELRVARDGERGVMLSVRDTGVGMDAAIRARLFEPFSQADATLDRSRGGLGLGLALVRRLVELHGGSVEGASDGPGRGSEFVVRLPRSSAASAAATGAVPRPRATGRRVLIVDDNVDAAETLRDVLELEGHAAAVAHDGREALAAARDFAPEVVLCDIGLPGMDGYAVARALRADAVTRGALLVALTGYALPDDLRRATEAGFDAHLAKPPSLEKIGALLARAPARPAAGERDARRHDPIHCP